MIEEINKILQNYGYDAELKDICEMFYDQGYMDTFCEDVVDSFEEYYSGVFAEHLHE